MSAEIFGASLLQEVNEESLSSLLSDVRTIHTPQPRSVTGLEELDVIIDTYRYSTAEETRTQNISSDPHPPFDDDENENYNGNSSPTRIHIRSIKKPNPVIINITQPRHSSPTATSLLLSHLTALAILPANNSRKYGTAVHIDCLNTFNATTLYNTTHSLIRQTNPTTPTTTTNQLAKSVLSHVHVIPCPSTTSLLHTLQDLPSYLLDPTAHSSSLRPLSLLIISGLNHFTWQDRFNTELTRLEHINQYPTQPQAQTEIQFAPQPPSTTSNNPPIDSSSPSPPTQLLNALKSIHSTFNCTIIYTTTPPNNPQSQPQPQSNDPPLQDIYTLSALLSLHPTRSEPPQFAPQMSLDECLRDRGKRMDAIRNVRYWIGAGPGGLSERGRGRMGFGMRRGGAGDEYGHGEGGGGGWVFES